jgi:hypothetical protein
MTDPKTQQLFLWINRTFWLIWFGFFVLVWVLVRDVLDAPAELAALAPAQAACLEALPLVTRFSLAGRWVFWGGFAVTMAFYAVLLLMAHQVIYRCATGRVFVAPMITSLRRMGIVIAIWPLVDLLITNLSAWAYVKTGDMIAFSGSFALDVPVMGVGLLLVTMAAAMKMAVKMHQDASLTI